MSSSSSSTTTSPRERVQKLIDSGAVAPEEGKRLLAAIDNSDDDGVAQATDQAQTNTKPKRSLALSIINPFDRFGGGVAAIVGAFFSIASIAISRLNVRFDGLLDLHIQLSPPPLLTSILEQGIAWLLPAICFFAYARVVAKHVRLIDFVGMVGLARAPTVLGALPVLLLSPALLRDPTALYAPQTLLLVTISLLFLAVNITWLFQGFKNASGLAGPKLWVGFIVGIIVIEMITKLALLAIPTTT